MTKRQVNGVKMNDRLAKKSSAARQGNDRFVSIGKDQKEDKETFSFDKIQRAGTELVENSSTLIQFDLERLLDDLGKLGTSIYIACNEVANDTELQNTIQGVKNEITTLTEKSAAFVQEIKETTRSDLKKLQNVFQFLLDVREKMAIETLKLLSIDARILATKAEALIMSFDNTTSVVIYALEDTQRTKGAREDHRRDLKRWGIFDDGRLEEIAIDALHNSVGALKSLSATMMNVAMFWRQMQAHCESLTNEDMQRIIERAMKFPEEKRLNVWTSRSFKTQAMLYCLKWLALDDTCGPHKKHIKQTYQHLYGDLRENPMIDEDIKNVLELVAALILC